MKKRQKRRGNPKARFSLLRPPKNPSDKAHGFLDGAFLLREFPRLPMPREGEIF